MHFPNIKFLTITKNLGGRGKQIVVSLKKRKEVFELKLHMQPKLIRGEKEKRGGGGGGTNMSSFRAACH